VAEPEEASAVEVEAEVAEEPEATEIDIEGVDPEAAAELESKEPVEEDVEESVKGGEPEETNENAEEN
jgi:hypothetical protein